MMVIPFVLSMVRQKRGQKWRIGPAGSPNDVADEWAEFKGQVRKRKQKSCITPCSAGLSSEGEILFQN